MRVVVLLLLLANVAWFAWAQGLLRAWGAGPTPQSEPQRLERQLRPELLQVVPRREGVGSATAAGPLRVAHSAAPAATVSCLASDVLDADTAVRLGELLVHWPAGSWQLEDATEPPRWIVYMGRYASVEHLQRKRAELRQRGVPFEALASAALEPGLSLGGFASEAEARERLEALALRGVRTATVVQERAGRSGPALRLLAADAALQGRIEPLRAALAGHALRPCG
ncbi:SPOR domain-containing protein [Ramlibacter sp. AN1015]|uniref:SPOR domain-containing protein n=1 Tax=Ramlibacter sp. AN1015 TaxID=3133428 RepID=UPI0030BCE0F2